MSGDVQCILAVAPLSRGFGVFVCEISGKPIDWFVREVREIARHKNARCQVELDRLIQDHRPSVLVLEDHRAAGSKKRARIKRLLDLFAEHAEDAGMPVAKYGPYEIRVALGLPKNANKIEVANVVARRVPALKQRLPQEQPIWAHEDYGMPIFVAAGLTLAHLASRASSSAPFD